MEFYDNTLDELPDRPGWLRIDRIYRLDHDAMDREPDSVAAFWEIAKQLPEFRESGHPTWFGRDGDEESGYLSLSFEPPGLQIAGVLRQEDWTRWEQAFAAEAHRLPWQEPWPDEPLYRDREQGIEVRARIVGIFVVVGVAALVGLAIYAALSG